MRAYLDVDEIIRVAQASPAPTPSTPATASSPRTPSSPRSAAENGITFIGPPATALEMAGNKVTAKHHAIAAGVPVLRSTEASDDVDELVAQADDIGFPIFVKAVAGGGGRGMRRVETPRGAAARDRRGDARGRRAPSATRACSSSRPSLRPRHIEVQILADATGHTVHLFERDCSVQRRHQKVIEIAPAPNLDPTSCATALHRDAVAFAESIGYVNAGTVEFLVDTAGERAGEHVFIEMNPRIQVEHTVTEEVTDVDLVQSQMRIAAGETLDDLGLAPGRASCCAAPRCSAASRRRTRRRASAPTPDASRPTAHPAAPASASTAARPPRARRSARTSTRCSRSSRAAARDFPSAVARAKRALAEFRIRGVATNIPFLRAVLDDPAFVAGDLSTSFIDERPQLLHGQPVARPRHASCSTGSAT